MVKLVDTKDLKSLPFGSASSSLAEGTKITMIKFHFVFDKTKKSQNLKKKLLNKYINNSLRNADVIVVGGGDGFMLSSLKKYVNLSLENKSIFQSSSNLYVDNFIKKKSVCILHLKKKIYLK